VEARSGNTKPAGSWLRQNLLRLFLLLLTDAYFEVLHFRFLKSFVVMPGYGIREIGIHVGILGKHSHQREVLVAGRAERPETLHIGNCHNVIILAD
jgi:hypothetical protein